MAGNIIFAEIPKLDQDWQLGTPTSDPDNVWTVWDKNNYYLWGANSGNISGIAIGQSLHGGGLAGPKGPTRGLAHPHYVGVNTMQFTEMSENITVFAELTKLIANDKNIVVPIFHDKNDPPGQYKYSLGTGLGSNVSNWMCIQKFIFNLIIKLSATANDVVIPSGVFWPDCRNADKKPHYPITNVADMITIMNMK